MTDRPRVVLGVAGGIAAYKAVLLVRLLDKAGAHVDVAMTARAQKFIGAMTFQALTRRPVFTNLFDLTEEANIGHIQLADRADLVRALVALYKDNAATLTPDPLHSAFYDSHPPAALRVARLQQLEASV